MNRFFLLKGALVLLIASSCVSDNSKDIYLYFDSLNKIRDKQIESSKGQIDSIELEIILRTEALVDKMVDTLKVSNNLLYDNNYLSHFFTLKTAPYSLFVRYDLKLEELFTHCKGISDEKYIINSISDFHNLIGLESPLTVITTLSIWEIQMLERFACSP